MIALESSNWDFCETVLQHLTHQNDKIRVQDVLQEAEAMAEARDWILDCIPARSNVGKSSLIRVLFSLALEVEVRDSKTPGHTRKINFFKAFTKVDMPGYGHRAPKDFVEMVEPYLDTMKSRIFKLYIMQPSINVQYIGVLGCRRQSGEDVAIGGWKCRVAGGSLCRAAGGRYEEFSRPYVSVVTKMDKCHQGVLLTNLLQLQDVNNADRWLIPTALPVMEECWNS
ncbi:unnamed protein product [Coregonus sp. 'balchen']|nr:unnamed protein product [Coregonus sp. 'balchen']